MKSLHISKWFYTWTRLGWVFALLCNSFLFKDFLSAFGQWFIRNKHHWCFSSMYEILNQGDSKKKRKNRLCIKLKFNKLKMEIARQTVTLNINRVLNNIYESNVWVLVCEENRTITRCKWLRLEFNDRNCSLLLWTQYLSLFVSMYIYGMLEHVSAWHSIVCVQIEFVNYAV